MTTTGERPEQRPRATGELTAGGQPSRLPSGVRARRSRPGTISRTAAYIAAALVAVIVIGSVVAIYRVTTFVNKVSHGLTMPWQDPPKGSIPWKLSHGQQVNLLILGYGGSENDAPYLTDTIMVVTLDPASHRIVEASVPRDLYVQIDAWAKGQSRMYGYSDKINAAFMVGTVDKGWGNKLPQYRGQDGGGHLAMTEIEKVTGMHVDKYAAVDFRAFRDVVDALGGVDVCLSSPLDDYLYPDYHDHYVKGGIHFKAGCQHLNGERALELARSRKAIEPDQQTDFARARRQQMLLSAIKKKALSVNGVVKGPFLMSALEKDFKTDMTLQDMRAVYDYTSGVSESNIVHIALTDQNLLDVDTCGPSYLYTLCPQDPTYSMLHRYFSSALVDPSVLNEHAPISVANASYSSPDLSERVVASLGPYGFHMGPPLRFGPAARSIVYDFSGGKYPKTAQWLAQYFGATVKPGPPSLRGYTNGLLLALGHDFASRWYGRPE